MNSKKETLTLKLIAAYLQIRSQRLLYKAERLGLKIEAHGTIQNQDAIILVQSYVESKKTSTETKQKAIELINSLTNQSTKKGLFLKKVPIPLVAVKSSTNLKWFKRFINNCTDFTIVLFAPITKLVQNILKNSVQVLESVYFKFVALLVAISVQMHHSAIWFQRVTPDENTSVYAAYGYAFMVDLFILVITMEGKISIAKTFATLTFLSNVLYFQFWVRFSNTPQAYTNAISSLLISGIMAYIIYAYTELFVKYRQVK